MLYCPTQSGMPIVTAPILGFGRSISPPSGEDELRSAARSSSLTILVLLAGRLFSSIILSASLILEKELGPCAGANSCILRS